MTQRRVATSRCNVALQRRVATSRCNGVLQRRVVAGFVALLQVHVRRRRQRDGRQARRVGRREPCTYARWGTLGTPVRHTGLSWYTRKVHSVLWVLTSFQPDCGVRSRKVLWVL
jgi:hypothetical protein